MSWSRTMVGGLAVLAAVIALVVVLAQSGSPRGGRAGSGDLGPTPRRTSISFTLSLKVDERRLDQDLRAGSPPVTSAAVAGRRYGLPLAAISAVRRQLVVHGITVEHSYPQRTALDVRASVGTISRYFAVHYRDRRDPLGERYHAPTGRATIPRSLRRFVSGVVGLSTRTLLQPRDVRQGGLVPQDGRLAYDVTPLARAGFDGRGESIAVVSFARLRDPDIRKYRAWFQLRGPTPRHVRILGGANSAGDITEANLDADVISGVAPGAQILFYEAPNTAAGDLRMMNRIVAGKARIVSDSWGQCDDRLPADYRRAEERTLKIAVRRGITFFVSSGDSGAYDCQSNDFADHRRTVDFPSDSASVVSVGGTLLSVNTNGSYRRESAWEYPLAFSGGGGGVDPIERAPTWQLAHHVGNGRRGVPDVAAAASPGSGWFVQTGGDWEPIGGTSAAAPFWAASMVLAQQYAKRHGLAQTCFLAPLLYKVFYARQRYFPAFNDVISGGNRYYDAAKGWDYATGLGSPRVYNLARDLVAYRIAHGRGCG